ncbi:hypothetical protein LU293_09770 [Moraxella nasovis]|uniref:hypothetical protein n=1 Tax=Moraxella nasovis TaxID=2904121 RepID=UPI001F61BDE7|nr:hypothetical protein [Moraxella nasovis]UNU73334.1 hypothetical protein LU293_09770 [Moraxella nasovis]
MKYDNFINSLNDYLHGRIDGRLLLNAWQDCPEELKPIYYQLFHLIGDEDIRKKDVDYKNFQLSLVNNVIGLLKAGDIEKLQGISLI